MSVIGGDVRKTFVTRPRSRPWQDQDLVSNTKTKVPRPRLHNPSPDHDFIFAIPIKNTFWPDMYELNGSAYNRAMQHGLYKLFCCQC